MIYEYIFNNSALCAFAVKPPTDLRRIERPSVDFRDRRGTQSENPQAAFVHFIFSRDLRLIIEHDFDGAVELLTEVLLRLDAGTVQKISKF